MDSAQSREFMFYLGLGYSTSTSSNEILKQTNTEEQETTIVDKNEMQYFPTTVDQSQDSKSNENSVIDKIPTEASVEVSINKDAEKNQAKDDFNFILPKTIGCPLCKKTLYNETQYKRHTMLCAKKRLRCKYCGYNSRNLDQLRRHYGWDHGQRKKLRITYLPPY